MSIQACTCFRRGKVRAGVKGNYYNIKDAPPWKRLLKKDREKDLYLARI
jgi:hypothetical protein